MSLIEQQREVIVLAKRLNKAIGAFAGLGILIGLKWDTELAPLCNISSTDEEWDAAIAKAHRLYIEKENNWVDLIRQSISDCVSDAGSDYPKIHPPEIALLLKWFKAVGDAPKLPMECIRCGDATGPIARVDDDSPGYVCPDCYKAMQEDGET